MIRVKLISLLFLLFSVNVKGVERLKNVTPYFIGSSLQLEIVASFNMGSISDCPEMVGIDTSRIGDSLYLKVYYDISGVWAANFCQTIDTVDVGVLSTNLKMIRIEMYTTMYIPVDNDTDTAYCPQPWIIWLPLTIKEAYAVESLTILPNPNNGQFVLQGDLSGVSRFDIVDVAGRVVYADKTPARGGWRKKEIDMGEAPPGMYMLRLHTEKGVMVRKVLVE